MYLLRRDKRRVGGNVGCPKTRATNPCSQHDVGGVIPRSFLQKSRRELPGDNPHHDEHLLCSQTQKNIEKSLHTFNHNTKNNHTLFTISISFLLTSKIHEIHSLQRYNYLVQKPKHNC